MKEYDALELGYNDGSASSAIIVKFSPCLEGNKLAVSRCPDCRSFRGFVTDDGCEYLTPLDITTGELFKLRCAYNHLSKPERWRAAMGGKYWRVDNVGIIIWTKEDNDSTDDGLYKAGNYFKTREEAQKMADKFKALLKEEA